MGLDGNVITYNGEIYNYIELHKSLSHSWGFETESDTEALLAAYNKYDVDCLRLQHIFKSIDTLENEVRVYIEGQDFYESEAPHPLPYATLDGKKKSMENLFKEAIGEIYAK